MKVIKMINKNSYYYLNIFEYTKEQIKEGLENYDLIYDYLNDYIIELINTKDNQITEMLKDYSFSFEYDHISNLDFDNITYEVLEGKLYTFKCNNYFLERMDLIDLDIDKSFFKEFNVNESLYYEVYNIFEKTFKNIRILYKLKDSYEQKLENYFKGLLLKNIRFYTEDLIKYFISLIRSFNMQFEFRGYGILFDLVYENLFYCESENLTYDLKYTSERLIQYQLNGSVI